MKHSVSPDESGLIRQAQAGDQEAFSRLVLHYQRRVFALGVRFFGSADDAEDLVQECFLRAWRALDRFDPTRPFLPWLMRIASNWALTEIATRKRRGNEELNETIAWSGPGADENLERRELQAVIGEALGELPDDQRIALLLRTTQDLSYREISDALGIPIGTVMSRLARARETMRQKVRR